MALRFLPYLTAPGNAAEILSYYNEVFGGRLELMRYGDVPTDGMPFDPSPTAVAHGQLEAGDVRLAGGDAMDASAPALDSDVYSFLLLVDTVAEAEELIGRFVATGATVEMPFMQAPWGDHYGQVKDKFGVLWAFDVPAGPAQ